MKTLDELLRQVKSNQKHERHMTRAETLYWCRQWRLLAEQFAEVIKGTNALNELVRESQELGIYDE